VSRDDASSAAIQQIADAVGGLMESWGFKRNMGRMWTILYLEDRPLSAPEIGERLALSAGAVSMLMAELSQWGATRKTWVVGERREHYEAETSIWKMVSRVFRERELRWIQTALEQFEAAKAQLDSAAPPSPPADKSADAATGESADAGTAAAPDPEARARARLIADRVTGLTELARVGAHLLEAMLQGEAVDHMPIKKLGELARLTKPV
jgi:HTH-type transcriptional regulator, glycine betaine synthesis regulator